MLFLREPKAVFVLVMNLLNSLWITDFLISASKLLLYKSAIYPEEILSWKSLADVLLNLISLSLMT